jgi:predicted nucleotidyltransferase
MNSLKNIEEILKANKNDLKKRFKVKKIGIFGSYTRNEQNKKSDLDILVEFSEPIGWDFIELKEHLEKILGVDVDLVTVNALKPQLKDTILQEVIYT